MICEKIQALSSIQFEQASKRKKHNVIENAQLIHYWTNCEDRRMKRVYFGFKNSEDEVYREDISYQKKTFFERYKKPLNILFLLSIMATCLLLAGAVLSILAI